MKGKNVQTEMAQMQITIRNEIAKFFEDTIKQIHVQFGSVIRHDNIQGLQRTLFETATRELQKISHCLNRFRQNGTQVARSDKRKCLDGRNSRRFVFQAFQQQLEKS